MCVQPGAASHQAVRPCTYSLSPHTTTPKVYISLFLSPQGIPSTAAAAANSETSSPYIRGPTADSAAAATVYRGHHERCFSLKLSQRPPRPTPTAPGIPQRRGPKAGRAPGDGGCRIGRSTGIGRYVFKGCLQFRTFIDFLKNPASRLAAAATRTTTNRKRALSTSPYSDLDLIRQSPTLLNGGGGGGGSPSSSGSFHGGGAISPALGIHAAAASAHIIQAHLLRSASSPYLAASTPPSSAGPPNSAAFLHSLHTASSPYFPLFGAGPVITTAPSTSGTTTTASSSTAAMSSSSRPNQNTADSKENNKPEEPSSNVVSSTIMDDEDTAVQEMSKSSGRKKSHSGGNNGGGGGRSNRSVRAPASSSTGDKEDNIKEEEPDFIETHCRWVGCERDFGTQDNLVKVSCTSKGSHKICKTPPPPSST